MKRIIAYVALIILFVSLGCIGLLNQPVDYLNEEILNNTYYRYNIKDSSYEELVVSKEKIEYKGNTINLNNCVKYKYQESTGIIKMDCGRAFRVIAQKKDFLVFNIDNTNYYFFADKNNSYTKEFNSFYGMTEEDLIFEVNEKLEKYRINSDLLDELIKSTVESYVFVKVNECKNECLVLAYNIDKLTEENIYYIEKEDLNVNQISELNNKDNNSKNVILKVGKDKMEIVNVEIKSMADDLTGYLDKNNEE